MSNPYAPPEDRPQAPSDDGTSGASHGGAPGPPADGPSPSAGGDPGSSGPTREPAAPGSPTSTPGGGPYVGPAGLPERSLHGVPYERPRGAAPRAKAPTPHPTDVHRLSVLVRTTALLVLVAVLADLLAFPWYLAAGAIGLAALAVGGRALALAARTGQRGAPRAAIGLLLVVAFLGLARPGMALLTWDAESAYARCQAGALTVQAQNTCVSDYEQALDDRAAQLTGRTP